MKDEKTKIAEYQKIAALMGFRYELVYGQPDWYECLLDGKLQWQGSQDEVNKALLFMKFEESYASLMGVVEKIESLGFSVAISNNECRIKPNGFADIFRNICWTKETKKQAIYLACLDFCVWYSFYNEKF
jgi:hypothetical protein